MKPVWERAKICIRGDYLIRPIRVGRARSCLCMQSGDIGVPTFSLPGLGLSFQTRGKRHVRSAMARNNRYYALVFSDPRPRIREGRGDGLSGGGGWLGRRRGTVVSRQGSGVGVLRQRSVMPNGR